MLISDKGHTDTMQVYSVTVMTHVKALQAGHSSQGTSEPITPVSTFMEAIQYTYICSLKFMEIEFMEIMHVAKIDISAITCGHI